MTIIDLYGIDTTTGKIHKFVSGDTISGAGTVDELRLLELSGDSYVGLKAPSSLSTTTIWILPSADGTEGQVLQTDGSGVLSWTTVACTIDGASFAVNQGMFLK